MHPNSYICSYYNITVLLHAAISNDNIIHNIHISYTHGQSMVIYDTLLYNIVNIIIMIGDLIVVLV